MVDEKDCRSDARSLLAAYGRNRGYQSQSGSSSHCERAKQHSAAGLTHRPRHVLACAAAMDALAGADELLAAATLFAQFVHEGGEASKHLVEPFLIALCHGAGPCDFDRRHLAEFTAILRRLASVAELSHRRFTSLLRIKDEGGLPARCVLPVGESQRLVDYLQRNADPALWSACTKAFAVTVPLRPHCSKADADQWAGSKSDGGQPALIKCLTLQCPDGGGVTAQFNHDASCVAACTASGSVHVWRTFHASTASVLTARSGATVVSHCSANNGSALASRQTVGGALSFVLPSLVCGRKSALVHTGGHSVRLSCFDNYALHAVQNYVSCHDTVDHIETCSGPATGGAHFATCSHSACTVRVYNLEVTSPVRVLSSGEGSDMFALQSAWHPNGTTLAAACANGSICLFDLRSGRVVNYLNLQPKTAGSMSKKLLFEPNGKLLAQFMRNGEMKLWDLAMGKLLHCNSTASAGTSFGDAHFVDAGCGGGRSVAAGAMSDMLVCNTRGNLRVWNWDGALHNYVPLVTKSTFSYLADDFSADSNVCAVRYNPEYNVFFVLSV